MKTTDQLERKWEDLGPDCLVNVFTKLGLGDMILGVPLVCKSWYQASIDPRCWRVLRLDDTSITPRGFLSTTLSSSLLIRFLVRRSCGSAVEAIFPADDPVSIDKVTLLSQGCPALKVLALPQICREDYDRIPDLVCNLMNLERLYVPSKPSYFQELVMLLRHYCRNLAELQTCGQITIDDAKSIAIHLSRLKHLCLSGSTMSKEALLLIMKGCRELEVLHVEGCRGLAVDEEVMGVASGIKDFRCHGTTSRLEDWAGGEYNQSASEVEGGYWLCEWNSDEDSIS